MRTEPINSSSVVTSLQATLNHNNRFNSTTFSQSESGYYRPIYWFHLSAGPQADNSEICLIIGESVESFTSRRISVLGLFQNVMSFDLMEWVKAGKDVHLETRSPQTLQWYYWQISFISFRVDNLISRFVALKVKYSTNSLTIFSLTRAIASNWIANPTRGNDLQLQAPVTSVYVVAVAIEVTDGEDLK